VATHHHGISIFLVASRVVRDGVHHRTEFHQNRSPAVAEILHLMVFKMVAIILDFFQYDFLNNHYGFDS